MTATQKLKPIKGPEAGSREWYALRRFDPDRPRKVIIGASEAAAACNLSPYSSALQLYLEKRGEWEKEFTPEQRKRIDMGKRLEPVILDLYVDERNCFLERGLPMYFHPAFWWMAATPDAIASRDMESQWCVEAKQTNWRMLDKTGGGDASKFGAAGTDYVPVDYLCQAQQQMAVMGLDRCEFPVLVDSADLRIYVVERCDGLIDQIAAAEKELCERIINGEPPEPNWEHSGTKALLHKMHPMEVGKVVELTEEEADRWTRREHLSEQKKAIEKEIDELTAHILWALGDGNIGRIPGCDFEIRRTVVADSIVSAADVAALERKIGQVGRKGHSRLSAKRLG